MKWYSILLFPFAMIYWIIIVIRNFLYDVRFYRSLSFDLPVIVVGNLSVGGTGKTPHTIHIARLLQKEGKKVAILSRGYRRRTKGFIEVHEDSTVDQVGDEPLMMYHSLKKEVQTFVCENRVMAIMQMIREYPDIDVILLDDAFQHRALKAGFNILLTTAKKPFYKDYILPIGSLRDLRKSHRRADLIITTKSNDNDNVAEETARKTGITTLSSSIKYQPIYNAIENSEGLPLNWVLVTGIAQPEPLLKHLKNKAKTVKLCQFPDHHRYSATDVQKVQKIFDNLADQNKGVITTLKDWVKIKSIVPPEFQKHWYIQDIDVQVEPQEKFEEIIINYVSENKRNY